MIHILLSIFLLCIGSTIQCADELSTVQTLEYKFDSARSRYDLVQIQDLLSEAEYRRPNLQNLYARDKVDALIIKLKNYIGENQKTTQSPLAQQPQLTQQKLEEEKKDKALAAEIEEPITQPLPFASNGLLIFLDQGNETGDKMGAVGTDLLIALNQKPCAILASRLLIRDIIKQPTPKEFAKKLKDQGNSKAEEYEKLAESREAIKNYLATIAESPSLSKQEAIVSTINSMIPEELKDKKFESDYFATLDKEFYPFNPDDWIIKKMHDQLLLLVPKDYINKVNANNFAQYYEQVTYSPAELNLGIKIDHLADVGSLDTYVNEYSAPAEKLSGTFLIDSLANLFITRAEYKKISKQKFSTAHLPQWAIYLMGHGGSASIVNMSIDHFKQLLAFFDTKIVTKLVTYISCYGAGANTQKIYGDLKSAGLKTNPYSVVTAALTDAPVTRLKLYSVTKFRRSDIDFRKHRLKPTDSLNFKYFIDVLARETTLNFKSLLQNLFPEQLLADPSYIFGSPQIKLPGVEWFNLVNIDDNVVSIGQTLATSRSSNQPLNIMQFFGTRFSPPIALLVYANIIPFELIIPVSQMPIIVPMIPGDSYHEFAAITVNTTLKDFFKAMEPLKEINFHKTLVIKKLKVTGVTQTDQGDTYFKDVLIKVSWNTIAQYVTDKSGNELTWYPSSNELTSTYYPSTYLFEEQEQVEKARTKMQQAEQIRKAQERRIKAMQEKKEPAQVIEEVKLEKKREEEQKEIERQKELERQRIAEEERQKEIAKQKALDEQREAERLAAQKIEQERKAKEQEKARIKETELDRLRAKYGRLSSLGRLRWVNATNKNLKNEALTHIGKSIENLLLQLKKSDSKEEVLETYNEYTKELKSFFDEFTGEYDPEIRKGIEKKLEDFKNQEIVTMP